MEDLELVVPALCWKDALLEYWREFETRGDSMDGSAGLGVMLRNSKTVEDWLDVLKANAKEETVRAGFVPATTFLGVRKSDRMLVGMVDIRHRLNDHLFRFGGHVGYSVRPSQRRRGYARALLALALEYCRGLNIDRVLVTCDSKNEGSRRTILDNGGILENEVPEDGGFTQRYWIPL